MELWDWGDDGELCDCELLEAEDWDWELDWLEELELDGMLGELDELLELEGEGIPAELLELLPADWQAASARLNTPSTTNFTICICCNLIGVRITKWGWIAE